MGQSGTKVLKKVATPVSNAASYLWGSSPEAESNSQDVTQGHSCFRLPYGATVFIMKRRGSMYFDEDGDLAHEFYEERFHGGVKRVVMKRKTRHLRPQGEVDHAIPRLNLDLPFVLCEAPPR